MTDTMTFAEHELCCEEHARQVREEADRTIADLRAQLETATAEVQRWSARNARLESRMQLIRQVASGFLDDVTIAELRKARGLDPL